MKLSPDKKFDLREVLKDLDKYRPKRKGWTWRRKVADHAIGPFVYKDSSENLKHSVPLSSAHAFEDLDPQCDCVITTEIASGRFEDDLRRMRMAAWHGADHIMVIRTTGQSHIDGLIEGTPEGVGGIPISRKQLRATRKALDAIEEEVGRPINFHSYVSGLAGPEMAVLFAEEGVNTARQTLMGLDGLLEQVALKRDGPLREKARELKERAVLFLEEILEEGGYYAAVAAGQFVDSGYFPERNADGIVRDPDGGDGVGTVIRRAPDYGAPVCSHFGNNVYADRQGRPCDDYGGCTLCDPSKIQYIDELDV